MSTVRPLALECENRLLGNVQALEPHVSNGTREKKDAVP